MFLPIKRLLPAHILDELGFDSRTQAAAILEFQTKLISKQLLPFCRQPFLLRNVYLQRDSFTTTAFHKLLNILNIDGAVKKLLYFIHSSSYETLYLQAVKEFPKANLLAASLLNTYPAPPVMKIFAYNMNLLDSLTL